MQFRLPKPLRGWREFAGEVGIIVFGVLIALAAQQLVEAYNWRKEVDGLRAAVRDELATDLGTYPYRAKQEVCIDRRLDELQRWLDSWRAGKPLQIHGEVGIPVSINIRTGVWDSRDPETLSHMLRRERLDYGYIYGEFANNDVHRLDERSAWIELNSFNGATELDHADQIRLQGLIYRARLRDRRIGDNYGRFSRRAAAMGIRPRFDPIWPPIEALLCQPTLQPKGEALDA